MVGCGNGRTWVKLIPAFGLILSVLGCGHKDTPGADAGNQGQSNVTAVVTPAPLDPKLDQPFAEAVMQEPPVYGYDEQIIQLPPVMTIGGKSVGALFDQVKQHWNEIRFVAPSGKKLNYTAV